MGCFEPRMSTAGWSRPASAAQLKWSELNIQTYNPNQ